MEKTEPKNRFPHQEIETKWKKRWEDTKLFHSAEKDKKKKKFTCMDMFPYPSGAGLHVGHMESYTAMDIYSRYMRMKDWNVMHPIGWDAFGLPAENFAIKVGQNPEVNTREAIDTFRRQDKDIGLAYNWDGEFASCDPEYYRWTQWFFLFMYKHGLAYKAKSHANWCCGCQTVLANEQVIDGKCERCDSEVIQKDLEQWFFKITAYADQLAADLDKVDWPESTKVGQRNWIGRSEGATIKFRIQNTESRNLKPEEIGVFTTRADTIYGATYLVLAPEHPLVDKITTKEQKEDVENYKARSAKKNEIERCALEREKTGIFTGAYAINPANGKEIPIWIADYVVMSYGSGAIMAVPAHDERDFEFAKKYKLPVVEVVKSDEKQDSSVFTGNGKLVNSGEFDGIDSKTAAKKIVEKLGKEVARPDVKYKMRDWLISRQRYWGAPIPIIYCDKCGIVPVSEEDLPVLLPDDVEDFRPKGTSPLATSKKFNENVKCPKCGAPAKRELDTMDTFICSSWYFMRYADPHNSKEFASKEALKYWMPVDLYVGGAEYVSSHLLFSRFFVKALYDKGVIGFDEPFMKLRHQGMILGEDHRKMSKRWNNVINPDDVVSDVGADSARMYVMFMGPLADQKSWNTNGLHGVRRFVDKLWKAQELVSDGDSDADADKAEKVAINKLIKRTAENIEELKLNVCVSDFMIFVNRIIEQGSVSKETWKSFIKVIAPFAPFVAEELWDRVGEKYSVHQHLWPEHDEKLIKDEEVTIAVQVNGKVRGEITISPTADEKTSIDLALSQENIKKYADSKKNIKKAVYVKGRILNLIVG